MVPWTQERRPTWFDLTIHQNTAEFSEADGNAMQAVANQVWDTVLGAVGDYVDPRTVTVMGFGQGAAMALLVAMGAHRGVAGVASLHGWIPGAIHEVCSFDTWNT